MTRVWQGDLTLMEHMYFTSREISLLYVTEPVIGNYALAYALGWCSAPYSYNGPPRYRQDLGPLNEQEIYVTPATFDVTTLRYAFSQFNGQTDSYFFRFDQNAIGVDPEKKARAANFPQNGKLRMIGQESRARLYVISRGEVIPRLPSYIRLGKFNSKARIEWQEMAIASSAPEESEQTIDYLLNAADLTPEQVKGLRGFNVYNLYPAPLISRCRLQTRFWQVKSPHGGAIWLPTELRFGV
jgi:CRISPR-associated protein Csc1